MKKFLKIGKSKKSNTSDTGSVASSPGASTIVVGYDLKVKDLPKLHKAAWSGDLSKVKSLAKKVKDASPLDKENRTPLHLACTRGHVAVVEELLAWKAKTNKGDNAGKTPLMKAVECHHYECVTLLVDAKAEVNNADLEGSTALHYAVQDGEVDIAKVLLANGNANPDVRNRLGHTPLHVATLQKYGDVCHLLLNADADIDVTDEKRRTPLMHACYIGSVALVKLFLSYHADITIKDTKGWTAEDCAAIEGHHSCAQLIQEHTSRGRSFQTDSPEVSPEPSPEPERKPIGGFGAPVADVAEISEADASLSLATPRLEHLDSWDSEEESLGLGLKNQPVKVNLAKFVKSSDTEDSMHTNSAKESPKSRIPKRVDSDKQKKVEFTSPTRNGPSTAENGRTKIPVLNKKVSQESIHSEVGDSWNDDESLGLGLPPSGQGRKPLLRQDQFAALVQDDTDVESNEEDLPIMRMIRSAGPRAPPRHKHKKDSKILNSESAEEKKQKQKEIQKKVMEELGLSDVSDVSDPEDFSTSSPRKKTGESDWDDTAAESIPKMTPRDRPQSAASDWDTTVEDMTTPRTPRQRADSVKSEGSAWDSDEEDVPPAAAAPPQPASIEDKPKDVKQIVEIGSDDEGGLSPIAEESLRKSVESSAWDSTVIETRPPPLKHREDYSDDFEEESESFVIPFRIEVESGASDWDSTEAESPRNKAGVNVSGIVKKPSEDEESAWDSDDGDSVLPTDQPITQAKPLDRVNKIINESDEETEETISEWELERKKVREQKEREEEDYKRRAAAELVRQAEERERLEREAERVRQEERLREERQREERLREEQRQREEELERKRREQEEVERRRREVERAEEERRQRERELKRQKELEAEREQAKLKRLAETLEKEKVEFELEVQKKLDRQLDGIGQQEGNITQGRQVNPDNPYRYRKKSSRPTLYSANSFDNEGIEGSGGYDHMDGGAVNQGDDRSRNIRQRREKAEKDLEDARLQHLTHRMAHPDGHGSGDDDTYTSDVAPDSPRDVNRDREMTSPLGSYIHGVLGSSTPIGNTFAVNGDDGLSYTSTENEDSVHMKVISTPRSPDPLNTSLNLNDSTSLLRVQEQLREQKRLLEKEKTARNSAEHKKKVLEKERCDLQRKVDDLSKQKSNLEQNKVELESKLRTIDYNLNEEVEKRKNAEVLLQKTKQQLGRKEEQYTLELDAKQKTELNMRNLQMELRTQACNVKQLEDEREELQRHLAHEKNARTLQEQMTERQAEMQQSINMEAVRNVGKLADGFDKFEVADEDVRAARETADKLKTELYATKLELDHLKTRQRDDQKLYSTENEDMQKRIDDLKNDIKLNEEALAHASMTYNLQLNSLKTDNTLISSNLEKEKITKDKIESELKSLQTRFTQASTELEKTQSARTDLERNLQREREELGRNMERKEQELNNLKDNNQSLYQRVGIAETKLSSIENELSVANTSLLERTTQMSNMQRDLDQRRNTQENQEFTLRKEKEENAKLQTKLESALDRLSAAQHECLSLKQQLESFYNNSSMKEKAAMDSQDKFAELIGTIRTDYDKTRITLEEKNTHLLDQLERYKEELRNAEVKRTGLEQEYRSLQHQHNETVKRLAVAEAALENTRQVKESIDSEKIKLRQDVEQFQSKLESAQDKSLEYQSKIAELVERLDRTETSTMVANQQLFQTAASVEAARQNKGDLEGLVHKLEIENTKLESSLQHEMERVETLQRDLQDSNKVRDTLEAMVTNLRGTTLHLEEKLSEETATRSMLAQEAQDSKGLWETEVKSRSKLGLRIAQLERSKQDAAAVAEEEKRRARKADEQKKVAETKVDGLQDRNTELQKEVATLKAHLKSAKKRLRELDSGESRVNTLHSEFDRERVLMEGTLSTVRRQMDDVQCQLQQEIDKKDQIEGKNRSLQQELSSLKTIERAYQKLEKSKRKLDEEFAQYKAHVKTHYVERAEIERLRQEYEVKARMEVNHKLEEVNAYLEEQAQAREKLDQLRSTNEQQLRGDYDRKQKELQDELSKLRAGYQDVLMQKSTKDTEVEKLKDLYDNEQKLREKLTNRLFKVNDVAANTKAMLSLERQRMRMSNPSLFNSTAEANGFLSSPVGSGKQTPVFGMNNTDGLSHKIRNELNRSIAKHLEASTYHTKDINVPSRTVDDSYLGSYNKSSNDYLTLLRRNYLL